MGNIGAGPSFQIIFPNIIFYFFSVKNNIFCEASTKNMLQNDTHLVFTNSSTYMMDTLQVLGIFLLST